jgi:hypothetical protein
MADQNLVKYIKDTQAAGFSENQIKDAIKKQGWPQEEIDAAFNEIKAPKTWAPPFLTKTPAPTPAATPAAAPIEKPKPSPSPIPSVEAAFGAQAEPKPEPKPVIPAGLEAAKPTEARPLTKIMPAAKPLETKEPEVAPKVINYAEEKISAPVKPPTVEQLVGTGDIKEPAAAPKEMPTNSPEKDEPTIKKSKGPLILKIAVIVLGAAILALATYCLIFSPQLFVPLDWLDKFK